jgi:hypothetical protein
LPAADEAVTAAIGDVAELGDIDVDQRAGIGVFVAAQGFAGDPVDVGESVDPAAHQDRVHGRGGQAEAAGDLNRAESCRHRNRTIARTTGPGVRVGLWCGRELRSAIPAAPSSRQRWAHLRVVLVATMNIFAASVQVQPCSTISRANRSRVRGVRVALGWDTKASGG